MLCKMLFFVVSLVTFIGHGFHSLRQILDVNRMSEFIQVVIVGFVSHR